MKARYLFICILILPLHGISQSMIPLSVGNKWTYIKTVTHNGVVSQQDTTYSYIKKTIVLNGKTWYVSHEDGEDYTVRTENDEQYEIETLEGVAHANQEFLIYGLPQKHRKRSYNTPYDKVTVGNKHYTLKTKLGTFKCLRYRFTAFNEEQTSDYIDTYICVGIGIIKIKMFSEQENTEFVLVDYTLN